MLILKNRIYAMTLRILRRNRSDIFYFLKELSPQLNEDSSIYIPLLKPAVAKPGNVHKFKPDEKDKYQWIRNMNICTVLDVGAWKGDSARQFHELFPDAAIYSFEPLSDCYEKLDKLRESIPLLMAFNFALGDKNLKMQINRSEFSPSSSLLKMQRVHKEAFPFTAGGTTEEIEVKTLDSVINQIECKNNVLLKIDVQGFEEQVLKGAKEALKRVKIIIIELSFVELYVGQPMFDKIYKMLTDNGFIYSGSWHQLLNPKDGTILQQNGIFIRPEV